MAEVAMHRHEIKIQDEPSVIEVSGLISRVANKEPGHLEFWTVGGTYPKTSVKFKVVGTGHPFDNEEWEVVDSAPRRSDGLVFHLLVEVDDRFGVL